MEWLLRDRRRRMRNLLDAAPISTWTVAEFGVVLQALGEIVAGRELNVEVVEFVAQATTLL